MEVPADYPMVVANRSTLIEEVLLDQAIKDMSKWQERYVHIISSHLHIGEVNESVWNLCINSSRH